MKDRKERKRLAEKKRLLEKAKMKGRKTKKATKNASKNGSQPYQQGYDRASADHSSGGSGLPDDEYQGHEYDDEENSPIPPSAPASPAELKPPLPNGNHPKIAASVQGTKGVADPGASRPA